MDTMVAQVVDQALGGSADSVDGTQRLGGKQDFLADELDREIRRCRRLVRKFRELHGTHIASNAAVYSCFILSERVSCMASLGWRVYLAAGSQIGR